MKTVEAVKGNWGKVFKNYNLPPITGKNHFKGKCPICGERGKFRIDDKNGTGSYICVCGSGQGWKLLQLTQDKDFETLASEIDILLGNKYEQGVYLEPSKTDKIRNRLHNRFNKLPPLTGTNAELYLKNRYITSLPTQNVRYSDKERNSYSAIYSIATDAQGNYCYLHRTILDGAKKADITAPKLMTSLQEPTYLEHAQSIAIRLFPITSTLGIAEGIETALSCAQIYKCNTWSTINAAFMKKFKAPSGVNHLIIFADSDANGTGLAAAFECANKNLLSNNDVERVTIRWAEKGDFNDQLKNGCEVYEWPLMRKKAHA
ncbi:toprim domain-containing protein [Budviciaceae bacterium CWB-B4]|uniref:Toprim domain-containing protein n=1 Tax=Limnobaculum xujianqingii TaxID=2738837 RepID=A0A9D7FWI8_9GAMM|nr:toprim domain-containing protein [Limnobaculum xujianqingii]MBK5075163.1 toprim domain-containing protein [Limnobaculum xujianqingii]MBK5178473.1 toprim domain-containing protein [Limnobaculum xujianqingii]